jgi:class 3 adenylate cyclase
VIGGVIGTDIIRYDVYGKDILIANKMESSGKEDKILVSESTKNILEENFENLYIFEDEITIDIPNIKTTVKGYFIKSE